MLVQGAAGGVGTAALQVAKGLGAETIGVVSTDEKERVAREAGADHVVRADGAWKDEVTELTGGGVDMVIDPVGGDRFTDSLRSLREGGRVVVVGFTGGVDPRGQGQPAAAQEHRGDRCRLGRLRDGQARGDGARSAQAIDELIAAGAIAPGGRRALSARARRRGAGAARRARRDRQGRARRR